MQVEELTAQLGLTGLAQFLTGLREADAQVQTTTRQLKELTAAALVARAALGDIKVDPTAMTESRTAIADLQKALTSLDESAATTKACVRDVKMTTAQVAETAANADRQKESLKGIGDQAVVAHEAIKGVDIGIGQTAAFTAQSDIMVRDLDKIRDHAIEASVAMAAVPGRTGGPYGSRDVPGVGHAAVLDIAEQRNAAELSRMRNQSIRDAFFSDEAQRWFARTMTPTPPVSGADEDLVSGAASRRNASQILRLRMQEQFYQPGSTVGAYEGLGVREAERIGGAIPLGGGGSSASRVNTLRAERAMISNARQLARIEELRGLRADVLPGDMAALEHLERTLPGAPRESRLLRFLSGGGGVGGGGFLGETGGGGHGGGDHVNRGALFGLLPGGARGSQAAVTTLLGVAGAAGVAAGPGIAGLGLAAAAGATTLVGALGTLKLAFADITAAAFTQKAAFDKLTPTQQAFVQSLRSLDAGLVKGLEGTAQRILLPQLTSALHLAFTPAAMGSLQRGVGSFAGAIGGGAQQFGRMFGSAGFQDQFGKMLQQDAGYLRMFLDGLTHLTSAFVRLNVSAGPFLSWLGRATTNMAKWADQSIRADQANGRLAHFFDMAKQSVQAFAGLLSSVGHLASGFAAAVGFQNSIHLVQLLSRVIRDVGTTLRGISPATRLVFSNLLKSAGDVLRVLENLTHVATTMVRGLAAILAPVQRLTGGLVSLRVAIDAILLLITVRWIAGWGLATKAVGTAAMTMTAELGVATAAVSTLRLNLLRIAAMRIAIPVLITSTLYGPVKDLWEKVFGKNPDTTTVKGGSASSLDAHIPGAPGHTGSKGDHRGFIPGSPSYDLYIAGRRGLPPPQGGDPTDPAYIAGMEFYRAHHARLAYGGDTIGQGLTVNQASGKRGKSAFGEPPPFDPTGTGKAGVLPTDLENAILSAEYSGNTGQQRAALNAAVAWINAHIGSVKDATVRGQYMQEGISLKSQLASLASGQTTAGNQAYTQHISNISSALSTRQATLSAGRSALATAAAGTPSQEAHGARVALEFAHTQMEQLLALKEKLSHEKQTSRMKVEEARVQREINYTNNLINQAHKDQLAAVRKGLALQLSQHAARIGTAYSTFRSATGAGATPDQELAASNEFLRFAERQMPFLHLLAKDAKTAADRLRVQREINRLTEEEHAATKERAKAQREQLDLTRTTAIERALGLNPRDPHGAVAAARESQQVRHFLTQRLQHAGLQSAGSLQGDVQLLYKNHDINKKQFESLEKILTAINLMKHITGTVSSAITGNVSQRLQQIRDALRSATHPTSLHVPSVNEIMRGLHGGTAADRRIIADRIQALAASGGKISGGPDVFGFPAEMGAHPRAPGRVGGEGHVTIHGGVHIEVNGARGNHAQLAKQIRDELLKTGRRNPTQTRGPNAGRKLGLT